MNIVNCETLKTLPKKDRNDIIYHLFKHRNNKSYCVVKIKKYEEKENLDIIIIIHKKELKFYNSTFEPLETRKTLKKLLKTIDNEVL